MDRTPYERWKSGDYAFPGGFQLLIFQAYQHASGDNQKKLEEAYPEWFVNIQKKLRDNLIVDIAVEFDDEIKESLPYDIPCGETRYIRLSELPYPLDIKDADAFKDILLSLREKKVGKVKRKVEQEDNDED